MKVNTPCCRGLTGILSLPAVVLVKVVQLIVQEDRCSHAARRCERDVAERPIPIQLHSTGRDFDGTGSSVAVSLKVSWPTVQKDGRRYAARHGERGIAQRATPVQLHRRVITQNMVIIRAWLVFACAAQAEARILACGIVNVAGTWALLVWACRRLRPFAHSNAIKGALSKV